MPGWHCSALRERLFHRHNTVRISKQKGYPNTAMADGRRWTILAVCCLLLSGCPEDPMGPDNRMALIAFGRCDYDQALLLTERAIERGDQHHVQRAWMLKAAILQDKGDLAAAEAIYPKLEDAWEAVKRRPLKPSRRDRDIEILTDIARNERHANGLAPDCATMP